MRLLKCDGERYGEHKLKLTKDLTAETAPPYAALSHTWLPNDEDEITFEDVIHGDFDAKPESWAKIRFCGDRATQDGLKHFWVDTCCINKHSLMEVQEAITTMFSWYRNAACCYVYMADVSVSQADTAINFQAPDISTWEASFRASRWFTRGWTLQELLAPKSVIFFSKEGVKLGDKNSLVTIIHEITGIPTKALRGDALSNFSVDERFSWAANRRTKRREDKTYCLTGIFNVFIPIMYGEEDHASYRLRQAIENKEPANLDHYVSMLPYAKEAAFNSLEDQHESVCLNDTRTELLKYISQWIEGDDERCIFWLKGMAGTGKSTVARTVARKYHRELLVGSFFFSRGGGNRSKADKFVTTLARQLANKDSKAREYIAEAVKNQLDIMDYSLRDQWEHLVAGPLSRLDKHSVPSPVLIIIDALDECDGENDIRIILRVLATARTLTNIRIRIFITGRPEAHINTSFNRIPETDREVFILHQISKRLVDRDICLFFQDSLTSIREENDLESDWPGSETILRLVKNSSGLFIWASTACRYIRNGKRASTTRKRVHHVANGFISGAGPEKQLDEIYATVLRDFSLQEFDDEMEKEESYNDLRTVMGTIAVLCSPLSMISVAKLLEMHLSDVKSTLDNLQAVFNVSTDPTQPIRLHHPTIRDFLINKQRCSDDAFWVDEQKTHKALGDRCLSLMSNMLKPNICRLDSPGAMLKDVPDSRIKSCIPPELEYACLYWAQHYQQSKIFLPDVHPVNDFFKKYFLSWLEVVHLLGKGAEVSVIIRLYYSLLRGTRQIQFVKDVRRLMFKFQHVIKQAPLQAYSSAIVFLPPSNGLRVHFRDQLHPWLKNVRIARADAPKAKEDIDWVSDLFFFPDSTRIASGSNIAAVRQWNVATKKPLRIYKGDAVEKISAIAISPDGRTLAGGSDDSLIMAWNVESGDLLYSVKAHQGWINSLSFSPDCAILVSGSMDDTLAFWDAATGDLINRTSYSSRGINSGVFSPDGSRLAVASVDKGLRILNVSGEILTTLDGHAGSVNSVRFSPDGKRMVSGSDDMTVRLWEMETETQGITIRGHTSKVLAVDFSPDARSVASGSEDRSIRLWDSKNGAQLAMLWDHPSGINAISFSPDGRFIASLTFDDEVRVWETNTYELNGKLDDFEDDSRSGTLPAPVSYMPATQATSDTVDDCYGHSSLVTCLLFSDSGLWLASGSSDARVKVWIDGVQRWSFEKHTSGISALACSPDSTLLASASVDGAVKLWDMTKGMLLHAMDGHAAQVVSVAFSPDGQHLVSSSYDGMIILWDQTTGDCMSMLKGHTEAVNGIVFSPQSSYLVSWSGMTAVLWNLSMQAQSAILRWHSRPITHVAFSSNSDMLVSCSEDSTIRLWNREGTPIQTIESTSWPIRCVVFSPNDQFLACSLSDDTMKLRDLDSEAWVWSCMIDAPVRKMSFSRCGRYLETDRGRLDMSSVPSLTISSVATQSPALFVARNWIRRNFQDVTWLPDDYRACEVAVSGKMVVIGHESGAISFIEVT